MKISGKQIAMARILLDLNQKELADKLGIARKTILRIENGQSPGSTKTLEKIQLYFENNGLEFNDGDGVKRQTDEIRTLKGSDGFKTLMDEVYEFSKTSGGEICLYNAKPQNWLKWLGEDWFYGKHAKRMTDVKENIDFKITFEKGDLNQIASEYAEYRWFPSELWNEKSFYCFGNKLAFMDFEEKDATIMVLEKREFAEGFRILFNIAWDRVAIKLPPSSQTQ